MKLNNTDFIRLSEAPELWHGTPHNIDKFSTKHIGTGEGANSFGWGLYFTDKKEIAEYYRDTLTDKFNDGFKYKGQPFRFVAGGNISSIKREEVHLLYDISCEINYEKVRSVSKITEIKTTEMLQDIVKQIIMKLIKRNEEIIKQAYLNREKEKEHYIKYGRPELIAGLGNIENSTSFQLAKEKLEILHTIKPSDFTIDSDYIGKLYKVYVPDDAHMLLWDYSLNEQPKPVQEILKSMFFPKKITKFSSSYVEDLEERSGRYFYHALQDKYGDSDKKASLALLKKGIRGIKYIGDNINRNKSISDSDNFYNYVIFDDTDITILGN